MIYIIHKDAEAGMHSIASRLCDREIVFPPSARYAVISPAPYSTLYTTHDSAEAAMAECRRRDIGTIIMNKQGKVYYHDSQGIHRSGKVLL